MQSRECSRVNAVVKGIFLCDDDPTKGWDPDANVAVNDAEGTAYKCDVSIGMPNWNPGMGQCNNGSNPDAYHSCQRGYDCSMCGVYYRSGSEVLHVPGTQCSDTGSGCVPGLYNFDCCTEMCNQFGQQDYGCEPC